MATVISKKTQTNKLEIEDVIHFLFILVLKTNWSGRCGTSSRTPREWEGPLLFFYYKGETVHMESWEIEKSTKMGIKFQWGFASLLIS